MKYITIFLFSIILATSLVFGRAFRINQIPNGSKNRCQNCHESVNGGGKLNAFGTEVKNNFLQGDNVVWNAELAGKDSDGDGFSNGEELQDALGAWRIGNSNPGISGNVSNPGNPTSFPSTTRAEDFAMKSGFTVNSIYPNPANGNTKIIFSFRNAGLVNIELNDEQGNLISNLFKGNMDSGQSTLNLNLDGNIKTGIYFVNIKYNGFSWIEKLNVVR